MATRQGWPMKKFFFIQAICCTSNIALFNSSSLQHFQIKPSAPAFLIAVMVGASSSMEKARILICGYNVLSLVAVSNPSIMGILISSRQTSGKVGNCASLSSNSWPSNALMMISNPNSGRDILSCSCHSWWSSAMAIVTGCWVTCFMGI